MDLKPQSSSGVNVPVGKLSSANASPAKNGEAETHAKQSSKTSYPTDAMPLMLRQQNEKNASGITEKDCPDTRSA